MPAQLPIEVSNETAQIILSNNNLAKTVRRNTYAAAGLGIVAAGAIVTLLVAPLSPPKFTMIDPFGHMRVLQPSAAGERTYEDKINITNWIIWNIRGRTGLAPIDLMHLEEWNGQLTTNAAKMWGELGPRWGNPGNIIPGKRITISDLKVTQDLVDPHTMAAEWIETEGTYGRQETEGMYRIRMLFHYTDPKLTGGVTKLDAVSLRAEELIR